MIKKLQIKLIAVSMVSLFAVLCVIIGAINISNYYKISSEADKTLAMLEKNGGKFPEPDKKPAPQGNQPPQAMELPYVSRFFRVSADKNGSVVSVDTEHVSSVDSASAAYLATEVIGSGKQRGYAHHFRYLSVSSQSEIRLIFLDCSRDLSTFKSFLLTSCVIAFAGFATVFVLIVLISGRFVRPVSESYEKQKRFITDAGHEIKTPITIIDADAEVLEMEQGENEWISDIKKQSKRLADLTANLIYLSRMQEGKKSPFIDFPVSDVVLQTAQSFQSLALTSGKSFSWDIEPMIMLCGDQKLIDRLVSVLVDNAIKYSDENGSIRLILKKSGKNMVLSVSNTVREVEPEKLPRFFDRFYRVDASHNSKTGGYGIGLSIAKAIVESHKGKITATSPEEKMVCVTVWLPL